MNTEELIKKVVRQTVDELKRAGMLRDDTSEKYREASKILKRYYKANEEPGFMKAVGNTLSILTEDQYYSILPLYYCHGYTNESIAELLNVEVSTVTRNKKRLCIEFYNWYEKRL